MLTMGNEVSKETIAAAGAASAAAATGQEQHQERRKDDQERKGHVETAPNEEPPPPLDDSNNTERHVAIDLLGLKDRPVNPSNDDDVPAHFQGAAATNAAAAAAAAYAAAEEKEMEQQVTDYFKDVDGNEDDSDEDEVKSTGGDSKDTTVTEESRHVVKKKGGKTTAVEIVHEDKDEEEEEEQGIFKKKEGGKPAATVQVETVYYEDEEEDEDEDEEEEEEQGFISVAPLRVSTRIKARQEAAAKERKRASLLKERAPSKKDLIKEATKLGTQIRRAAKEAGELETTLDSFTHTLDRKGHQHNYGLRTNRRITHPLPTRSERRSGGNKRKNNEAQLEPATTTDKPKAQEEETARATAEEEETPTSKRKNSNKRRKVETRPTSVNCVKDRTVRAKFTVASKHISELQYCSTWENQIDRDEKPKSQHFMFTYDEMVQKPHCSKNSRIRRSAGPCFIFLCPEDSKMRELGRLLVRVGKDMFNKTGKGYHCTKNPDEYHDLVFGKKDKKESKP